MGRLPDQQTSAMRCSAGHTSAPKRCDGGGSTNSKPPASPSTPGTRVTTEDAAHPMTPGTPPDDAGTHPVGAAAALRAGRAPYQPLDRAIELAAAVAAGHRTRVDAAAALGADATQSTGAALLAAANTFGSPSPTAPEAWR